MAGRKWGVTWSLITWQWLLTLILGQILILHVSAVSKHKKDDYPVPHESRLVNMLLQRYKKLGKVARPVLNSSKTVNVNFGMRLIQMDIVEKEQAMKTSVWMRMLWDDEHLTWNPGDYGGITTIVLPWKKVWLPDITMVNTADTDISMRDADLMVSFLGAVLWAPHRVYKSACLIDITNYPYDRHNCTIWFQSTSYSNQQLDLIPYGESPWDLNTYLSSYEKSQEWEVLGNVSERVERPQDVGMTLKWSKRVSLRFNLAVRRRVGYIGYLLMLPCVFMACMSVIVFCLQPERPDRNMIAMSIFGSCMMLMLILVEVAPPSAASIPKLGVYYAFNMALVMFAIFFSGSVIYITNLADSRTHVPKLVKVIFIDVLSHFLCVHHRVYEVFDNYPELPHDNKFNPDMLPSVHPVSSIKSDPARLSEALSRIEQLEQNIAAKSPGGPGGAAVKGQVERDREVRLLRLRWKNIALVLDRIFILLYVFAIAISLIFLFPRP